MAVLANYQAMRPSELEELNINGMGFSDFHFLAIPGVEQAAIARLQPWGVTATAIKGSTEIFSRSTAKRATLGGIRVLQCDDTASQIQENLELAGSRTVIGGMTAKNAIVKLLDKRFVMGGGKSTINADLQKFSRDERQGLMMAFGMFQARFNLDQKVIYVSAEDMATDGEDISWVRNGLAKAAFRLDQTESEFARYATLTPQSEGGYGEPNPYTARSVLSAIKGLLRAQPEPLSLYGLRGLPILIWGCGNVGRELAILLRGEGAKLYLGDPNPDRRQSKSNIHRTLDALREKFGSSSVLADGIFHSHSGHDILEEYARHGAFALVAPCAKHHFCDPINIARMGKVKLVCGAENNIFPNPATDAKIWQDAGIQVVTDFVANLGGVALAIAEYYSLPLAEVDKVIVKLEDYVFTTLRRAMFESKSHYDVVKPQVEQALGRIK